MSSQRLPENKTDSLIGVSPDMPLVGSVLPLSWNHVFATCMYPSLTMLLTSNSVKIGRTAWFLVKVRYRLLEVGLQLVVTPSLATRLAPGVVLGRDSPRVKHGIYPGRASQRLPASHLEDPVVDMRLWRRLPYARTRAVRSEVGGQQWDAREPAVLDAAALDEEDGGGAILGEAVCEDAARRASACRVR